VCISVEGTVVTHTHTLFWGKGRRVCIYIRRQVYGCRQGFCVRPLWDISTADTKPERGKMRTGATVRKDHGKFQEEVSQAQMIANKPLF